MAGEGARLAQGWLELTVSTQGAQKTMADEVGGAAGRVGDSAGKRMSGGILGAMKGLAGPLAATFGTAALVGYFNTGIEMASDFQEAGTALNQVYGEEGAAEMQRFAAAGAAAFGQTTNEVLRAAQTFGVYGKAAGLAGSDLTGFSQDLAGLSTDLASFYNTSPEEAMEALAAGLRGESEPLRRFGVLLDDATLKARAMELGIYDGNGALTTQQKIMASQAEIMAQTADAQGDFARTSGGLANQQRILSAGWKNMQSSIGSLLLPALTGIVTAINTTIMPGLQSFASGIGPALSGIGDTVGPALEPILFAFSSMFQSLGPVFGPLIGQFIELAASVSPLGIVLQALTPILPLIASLLGTIGRAVAGTLSAAMTALQPVLASVAELLASALTQALEALLPVITQVAGLFAQYVGTIFPLLTPLLELVGQLFAQVLDAIMPLIPTLLSLITPILGLIEPLGELVMALLPPLIQLFMALLGPILDLVGPLLNALAPAIQFVGDVLGFLIGIIADVLGWLVDLITGQGQARAQFMAVWGAIQSFFGGVANTINGIWSGIMEGFARGWQQITSFFRDLPGNIASFFSGVGSWLWDAGQDLIRGLLDGIASLAGTIGRFFLDLLPDWIVGPFKAALGIASPSKLFHQFGEDTMQGYIEGVVAKRGGVVAAVTGSVYTPGVNGGDALAPGLSTALDRVTLIDQDGSILARTRVIATDTVVEQAHRSATSLQTGRRRLG